MLIEEKRAKEREQNYRALMVSRLCGTLVSILYLLWRVEANSMHLFSSPWQIMIRSGLGSIEPI